MMRLLLLRLALTILAFCSLPSFAEDRALIMTISEYPISPLPGSALDDGNVRHILNRIGFSGQYIRSLKDKDLTAAGIEKALAQLVAESRNGDRLYIHFSGHGASQMVNGRCQQSLVGQDLKFVSSAALADALQRLKDKASKVMVTIDACHSGGLVEEAGRRGTHKQETKSRFRPRFLEPEPGLACDKPANIVEETLSAGVRSIKDIPVERNYIYLAAARSNEVAYDDEGRGGMATASLMDCLNGKLADTDNSGSVTFGELAVCAQARIDNQFSADPVYRPHHLTLSGNSNMPLAVETTSTSAAAKVQPVATLKDLLNGGDGRWQVRIDAKPPRARIGKDAYQLSVTSSQGGYLYLLYVGSDHKEFLQLYPDEKEGNWINANTPLRIPGAFAAEGPAGTNNLLALVAHSPRDFKSIFKDQVAPATLSTATALQDATCASRNLKRIGCQDKESSPQSRNLQVVPVANGEADSYGAALVELVEE